MIEGTLSRWANWARRTGLGCAVLSSLATGPTRAASPWPTVGTGVAASDSTGASDAALVVAIEEYANLPDLPGARAAAARWATWFRDTRGVPAGRVVSILDERANRFDLPRAARQLAGQTPSGGTVWVVFVGHGAAVSQGADGVLVLQDAGGTPDALLVDSLRYRSLFETIRKARTLGAGSIVGLFDTAFSGMTTAGPLLPNLGPLDAARAVVGASDEVAVVAAGSESAAGPMLGAADRAFSYFITGALSGWSQADTDRDGLVSLQEAVAYADASRDLMDGAGSARSAVHGQLPQANVVATRSDQSEPDVAEVRRGIIAALDAAKAAEEARYEEALAPSLAMHTWGWIGAGVAGGALVLAGIAGGLGDAIHEDLEANCRDDGACGRSQRANVLNFGSYRLATRLLLGATGAAAVTSLTLHLIGFSLAPSREAAGEVLIGIGPGSLSLKGSF